jgi:uncharacterized membrane protein YfcA
MKKFGVAISGLCAGAVNGLFGAGGGMVLVPLLIKTSKLREEEIFPASVCIILPVCIVSLFMSISAQGIELQLLLPYLAGSAGGGLIAGLLGQKVPTIWLHRMLGALILWGGIKYLW